MNSIGYSPDILEKNENLNKKFNDKQSACDELMYILKERAELEEYYSRHLEKQAEQLRKLIPGKDNIKHIIISLQQIFTIQSDQSKTFAQSIKTNVLQEFSEFIVQQSEEVKKVQMVGRNHQVIIKEKMDKFDNFRQQYMSISQQLGQNNQNFSESLYEKKKNVENQMQDYIQHYNKYIDSYFMDYAKLTDSFKKLETDRREKIRDLVMKFFVYSISLISNLQYDVGRLSKSIESINLTEDIDQMFKDKINPKENNSQQNKNTKQLLSKVNFENYKYYMDYSLQKQNANLQDLMEQNQQFLPGFDTQNQQQNQQQQQQQQKNNYYNNSNQQQGTHTFSWMKNMFGQSQSQQQQKNNQYQNQKQQQQQQYQQQQQQKTQNQQNVKQNQHLNSENYRIYEQILIKAQQGIEINKHDIDTLKSFLKTRSDRLTFINGMDYYFNDQKVQHVQLLKTKSNITNITPEEIEIQLSSDAYSQILKIIYTFFEMCQLNYDINPIVQMYKITQKIFKLIELPDDQNGKEYEKICLQQGLQGNKLFSNIQYWQEYLKKFVTKVMQDYKKKEQSEFMDNTDLDQQSQQIKEAKFIEQRLKIQLESLIQLNISKENILESLKPIYNMVNVNDQNILDHIIKVQEFIKQQQQIQLQEQQKLQQKQKEEMQKIQKQQQQNKEQNKDKEQQQQINNDNQEQDNNQLQLQLQEQEQNQQQLQQQQFDLQLEENTIQQQSDKDSTSNPKQSIDENLDLELDLKLDNDIPTKDENLQIEEQENQNQNQQNNDTQQYENIIDISEQTQEKIPIQTELKVEPINIETQEIQNQQQESQDDEQVMENLNQQEKIKEEKEQISQENKHLSYQDKEEIDKYSSAFE